MTTEQIAESKKMKGPRLLGKWDFLGCAIFATLAAFGNHALADGAVVAIENIIGRFIGTLLLWAIIRTVFLWVKDKPRRT
jgi:hypothetical protein